MTRDEIKAEFEHFIEFDDESDKRFVTTCSTLLFAEYIAKKAAEKEREACAIAVENVAEAYAELTWVLDCIKAIRARGSK